MIAVSDASPVCYLVLVGEIQVLPKLFTQVLLPAQVQAERLAPGAPAPVQTWAQQLPSWVSVSAVEKEDPGLNRLQAGERAAIQLAESMDRPVCFWTKNRLAVLALNEDCFSGTLGVLVEAANRGLLDLPASIERLTRTNFRYSPALLKSALDQYRPK